MVRPIKPFAKVYRPVTPNPIFRSDDREAAFDFIAAHPFAMTAVNGENGPVSAMVPLVVNAQRTHLLGHVARANPFWRAAQAQSAAIAIFRGADGYVSPRYYPSKKEHGRVVSTWNYMAVELRGKITVETKPDAMLPYITALTDKMESHRDLPWKVSDAPSDYTAKLSRAIVGFRLEIDDITFVRKLSQNKSAEDRQGVIEGLGISDKYQERLLAKEMAGEE